jgi:hypothetical protein
MPVIPRRTVLAATITALSLGIPAVAQCELQWLPGFGLPGTDGTTNASVLWDPDGAGPRTPVLVLGGTFSIVGNVAAQRLATYDPATGAVAPLGAGSNGEIASLAVAPNGDLLAGGSFTTIGGVAAARIARWNGSSWQPLGSGVASTGGLLPARVAAITFAPNGDVILGGRFDVAGGAPAAHVARWNGSVWSPLGAGVTLPVSGTVRAVVLQPNGDVVVGGDFTMAGGVAAVGVARFDGAAWHPLGAGLTQPGGGPGAAYALLQHGGELYAGGYFGLAGGSIVNHIARWDGAAWSSLGVGFPAVVSVVHQLAVAADGTLVAAGTFQQPTNTGIALSVSRWNGASWAPIGQGLEAGPLCLVAEPAGQLFVGGANGLLRRFDGTSWRRVLTGFDFGGGKPLLRRADGSVLLAGPWLGPDQAKPAGLVEARDGLVTTFAGGLEGTAAAAVELPNGDLVVAGLFTAAGGVPCANIARYDGSQWSPLGAGIPVGGFGARILALAVLPNGQLVAAGNFFAAAGALATGIVRWDGTAWTALGGGTNNPVQALAVLPNGDLLAGGLFTQAGGVACSRLARWNGVTWSPVGAGCSGPVLAMRALPGGEVYVGGQFVLANGVTVNNVGRLVGDTFTPLGVGTNGSVNAIDVLPNGDLLVAGSFGQAGGSLSLRIARWTAAGWSPFGSPIAEIGTIVSGVVVDPRGEAWLGGNFRLVAGQVSAGMVRLLPPCPATVTSFGFGCASSGGQVQLAASSLPWLGSTFTATATGLPQQGVALAVLGYSTTSLPLATVLPQAAANCVLRVQPDDLELRPIQNGIATTALLVPANPALVGAVVHQQLVPLELDAQLQIVGAAVSNRLSLTVGPF